MSEPETRTQQAHRPGSPVLAGVVVGVVVSLYAVSFGAILTGPGGDVQHGVVMALVGTFAGLLIMALGGQRLVISQPQSMVVIVLSLGGASLRTAMGPGADPAEFIAGFTLMVVLSSAVTGLVLLLVGTMKLGRLSRVIPYPVVGGFLAATGVLLILRAIQLGNGGGLPAPEIPDMAALLVWVVPVLLGVLLAGLHSRIGPFRAIVIGVIGYLLLHFALLAAGVVGAGQVDLYMNGGIRLSDATVPPVLLVSGADPALWPVMLPTIFSVAVVSLLAVLMNLFAVEQMGSDPIRLDRKIGAAGVGNLFGAALGGVVAFQSPSLTQLAGNFSFRQGRGTLVAMAAVLAIFAIGGVAFIGYVPRGALAFVLSYVGAQFVLQWLWLERRKMPLPDYLIVLMIMIATILFGFIYGIIAGLVAAAFRFTIAYARLGLVRSVTTVAVRRSTTERSEPASQVLATHGGAARIYELQGFLFFGSVSALFDRVVEDMEMRPEGLDTVILDFTHVRGLDVSAVMMVCRLDAHARAARVSLWVTGVSEKTEALLRTAGLSSASRVCRGLDEALTAIETMILSRAGSEREEYDPLSSILTRARVEVGEDCFAEQHFAAGEVLFELGDASDSLLYLEEGCLAAELGEGRTVATFVPGAIIGEIGFLTGSKRTATMRALTDVRVRVVDKAGMKTLRKEHPALASGLIEGLSQILARRLTRTTKRLFAVEEG